MKRPLALIFGALFAAIMFGVASAQAAPLTVTLPAGPTGTVQAMVDGEVCGTATTSPTGTTVLTLDATNAACITPGATISFTSNGVAVGSTLTVPATGSGELTLEELDAAEPVDIIVPAVPGGSGTISAIVDGEVCATVTVSSTSTTTLSLPAACAVPGATISFTGAGGVALDATLTVPASGGGTLTLDDIDAALPVTVNVPAGEGALSIFVDGEACGVVLLDDDGSSTMLPASCAVPGGTVTFITSAGAQLGTTLEVPVGGGTITLQALEEQPVRILLPSGPVGTIIAMVDGEICGTAEISATGVGALVLDDDCVSTGAVVSFVTENGIELDETVTIGADRSVVLDLETLSPATPLNVVLPSGSGQVDIFVDGDLCAAVDLATLTTTMVALGATCIAPGGIISFEVDGEPATQVLLVPATGGGTVTVTDLDFIQAPTPTPTPTMPPTTPPTVPSPANTGYGVTAMQGETSVLPQVLIGLVLLSSVTAAGVAVRARIRD